MTLLKRLRDCVSDERDIEAVLSLATGGSAVNFSANVAEYRTGTAPEQMFARLRFKGGRISRLEPGPALQSQKVQDDLVERARVETSHTHGTFVVSRPIFAERPLVGVYSWNDAVRIGPCPEAAPIGKDLNWFDQGRPNHMKEGHLGPPFPLLLEVRVPRSPNPFIESNRTLRLLDRYQYLLTLFLSGPLRYAHWPSGRMWISVTRDGVPENHLLHPGFSTGEDGRQDDFPLRNCPPSALYQRDDYYDRLWHRDSGLQIPSSLGDDFALFTSLETSERDAFVRACYWYALGVQFGAESAIATLAFSTAIECILLRSKNTPCSECGKPSGPGPTQLFNQHVKRYGTVIPALESRRQSLYGVRSVLVHGSHASRVDLAFFSTQRPAEDQLLLLQIVAQRSLINWLRDLKRDS